MFTFPSSQRREGSGVRGTAKPSPDATFSHLQPQGDVSQVKWQTRQTGDTPRRLTPAFPLDKGESKPCSSLRRFRPPITARVKTKDAVPVSMVFRNERQNILHYAGPWRTSGDWWTDTQWAHEEWDVTLSQQRHQTAQSKPIQAVSTQAAAVYRIYQDLLTRQWFVEGVYD